MTFARMASAPRVRWFSVAAALLVVAAVFASFAPALSAGFLDWDDDQHVTANPRIAELDRGFVEWAFTTNHMGPYQPLAWLSLALDRKVHGLTPPDYPEAAGFHRTNLWIHAATSALFALLALRLFERAVPTASRARHAAAAMLAALLFAVHPLRCESVAWITERRDLLAGFFVVAGALAWLGAAPKLAIDRARPSMRAAWVASGLAAAACASSAIDFAPGAFLRARDGLQPLLVAAFALFALHLAGALALAGPARARYGLTLACMVLGCLSKGLALVLPLLLIVIDAWPLGRLGAAGGRARGAIALVVEKTPMLVLAACFAAINVWSHAQQPLWSGAEWSTVARLAHSAYSLAYYAWRHVAPFELLPIYEMPARLSWSEPRVWGSALFVAALAAIVVARRRERPSWAAASIAYVVALAPIAGFLHVGPQLVADRYTYLSSMPLVLLGCGALLAWLSAFPRRTLSVWIAAYALVPLFAFAAYRYARAWQTSEALWNYTASVDPRSATAWFHLGALSADDGRRAATRERAQAAHARAHELFRRGFALQPDPQPEVRLSYASNLIELGRPADALRELEVYLTARPHDVFALVNRAAAAVQLGRHELAKRDLRDALAREPALDVAWWNLGLACEATEDWAGAIEAFSTYARLRREHPNVEARIAAARERLSR